LPAAVAVKQRFCSLRAAITPFIQVIRTVPGRQTPLTEGILDTMAICSPNSILITGASSGIGAGLASSYANKGITLFLSGRDTERLEAIAEQCRSAGAVVHTRALDVTAKAEMHRWITECDTMNPIDLVIANAGVSSPHPTDTTNNDDIFRINVTGVLNTITPVIPAMQARKRGQLALMSSLAGLRGLPSAPVYSASKVAVRAYGEALRPLLAGDGICVNVIMPGFVVSRITDQNRFSMPMLMPAAKSAQIIKRGLSRDRARIAFPFPMYALAWSIAILPNVIADALLVRLPRKG